MGAMRVIFDVDYWGNRAVFFTVEFKSKAKEITEPMRSASDCHFQPITNGWNS